MFALAIFCLFGVAGYSLYIYLNVVSWGYRSLLTPIAWQSLVLRFVGQCPYGLAAMWV